MEFPVDRATARIDAVARILEPVTVFGPTNAIATLLVAAQSARLPVAQKGPIGFVFRRIADLAGVVRVDEAGLEHESVDQAEWLAGAADSIANVATLAIRAAGSGTADLTAIPTRRVVVQ